MKVVYSKQYAVNLGDHPWNTSKYELVLQQLKGRGILTDADLIPAEMADDEEILRVHTADYVQKIYDLSFSPEEEEALEIPLTDQTIDMFWLSAGGTLQASEQALRDGICVHLGGGFHHAFAGYGSGFCLINDIAVSVRSLIERNLIRRALVVDCDLHQGDGTARIFRNDPNVFTFSIHQKRNFPYFKQRSDFDVDLENGATDEVYLDRLAGALEQIYREDGPFDFLHYQAGADPYREDALSGLAITIEGLEKRDSLVLDGAAALGIPVTVTLGGGYAPKVSDVVSIHVNTILAALRAAEGFRKQTHV